MKLIGCPIRHLLLNSILLPIWLLLIAGCIHDSETGNVPAEALTPTTERVVFMAGFKPQANLPFVAAYVAQVKGFFAQQRLDVEVLHAGTGEHLKLLMAGDVDITTAAAASVLKRRSDPGLPIVSLALFGQRGQQAYMALKNSNIESLDHWEDKTFGYKISVPPDYLAMLRSANVDRSRITEVNAGFDPRVLTEGRVDILAVFKSNEPDTVRRLGFDVTVWDPADYGVPTLGLTYITRQDIVDQKSDMLERFLKATLKATDYIRKHPDEALDIVLKFAPQENREHQRFMLEAELMDAQSALTDKHGLGWMIPSQWKALYEHLIEFQAIPKPMDYSSAYTDVYLKSLYESGTLRWP